MWPLVLGIGGYIAVISAVHAFNVFLADKPLIICPMRRVAGVPCPTCGTTRAGTALLTLHPLEALYHNPFVTVLFLLFVAWVFARFVLRYRLVFGWTDRARRTAWGVIVGLFLVNWAWVLHAHGVF